MKNILTCFIFFASFWTPIDGSPPNLIIIQPVNWQMLWSHFESSCKITDKCQLNEDIINDDQICPEMSNLAKFEDFLTDFCIEAKIKPYWKVIENQKKIKILEKTLKILKIIHFFSRIFVFDDILSLCHNLLR